MIRFDRVTKLYSGNSKPALNGVDVEIKAGEFVFLVGASGSGKSSFLRLVLKEEKPSSGEIHVLGQRLSSISSRKIPYFRRSLGVVFQDFRLLPGRTVYQNVAFTLQVIGKSRGFIQEAVPDVLKMVGLEGKSERLPHELSGGEQQRVAIARAVVNKPAILLADEPTGNLDPATSAGIMQVLELINAGGTTVLMATHDVGIVDSMKRRVIELVGGDIVRDEYEGGYTTSIPIQGAAAAQPPLVTGAAAFAAAVAEEVGPVELPTSPRTVVESAPARYADLPDYDAYPRTAPISMPTLTGALPRMTEAETPQPAAPAAATPFPTAAVPAYASAPHTAATPAPRASSARATGETPAAATPLPPTAAAPSAAASVHPLTAAFLRQNIPAADAADRTVGVRTPAPVGPATASTPVPPAAVRPATAAVPTRGEAVPQPEPLRPATASTPRQVPEGEDDPLRHILGRGRPSVEPADAGPSAPAPAPAAAASAAAPAHDDDPLALAVRLGLRSHGAAPETTGSQEVGPTS